MVNFVPVLALPTLNFSENTTLNIVFSATYYSQVDNITYVYYIFHVLPTNVILDGWTL